VSRVHAVLGGSLGGNIALQFASSFPDLCESVIPMSCTGKTSPLSVGLRHVQRQAIMSGLFVFEKTKDDNLFSTHRLDPEYRDGDYFEHKTFPHKFRKKKTSKVAFFLNKQNRGLSVARQIAMLVYKSWDSFNTRFDWNAQPPFNPTHLSFQIENYLLHQGSKFSRCSFVFLLQSLLLCSYLLCLCAHLFFTSSCCFSHLFFFHISCVQVFLFSHLLVVFHISCCCSHLLCSHLLFSHVFLF
jgi:hypothetical protein